MAHDSRSHLELCLPSLRAEDLELEILVVDNASSDGTVEWLARAHPTVKVLRLSKNAGYASGNNAGLSAATAKHVLVLNPDTTVHHSALIQLLEVCRAHPRAFVTPKLLLPDGRVNACGNQMHFTGITTCIGLGRNSGSFTGLTHPLLLSGTAILASLDTWAAVGGFDESLFMYMEDADLSLRARAQGFEILCVAGASITHDYCLSMSPRKFYFLERNRLAVLIKNFERRSLVNMLPGLTMTEAATWMFAAAKGLAFEQAKLKGYVWLYRNRAALVSRRSWLSTSSNSVPLPPLPAALPIRELVRSQSLSRALERIASSLFEAVRPAQLSLRSY